MGPRGAELAISLRWVDELGRARQCDAADWLTQVGEGEGLAVSEIVPGSPAALAGLQEGDLVLALNGEAVSGADRVRVRDMLRDEGQEISLLYQRGDATESARIKLRRLI